MPGFPPSQTKSRVLLLLFSLLHSKWNAKKTLLTQICQMYKNWYSPAQWPASWRQEDPPSLSLQSTCQSSEPRGSQSGPVGFTACCPVYRSGGWPFLPRTSHSSSRWGPGSPVSFAALNLWKWVSGKFTYSSWPTCVSCAGGMLMCREQSVLLPKPVLCGWVNTLAYKLFEKTYGCSINNMAIPKIHFKMSSRESGESDLDNSQHNPYLLMKSLWLLGEIAKWEPWLT